MPIPVGMRVRYTDEDLLRQLKLAGVEGVVVGHVEGLCNLVKVEGRTDPWFSPDEQLIVLGHQHSNHVSNK